MNFDSTVALREYAEAMHDVQCLKGKKCTWKKEIEDLCESHTARIWLDGEEHAQWFRVAAAQVQAIGMNMRMQFIPE